MLRTQAASTREFLPKLPRSVVLGLGIAMLALIGYLDYETGIEWSFSIFYLLPLAYVTWYAGFSFGLAFAIASATIWGTVDVVSGHVYSSPAIPIWNSSVRFGFFATIAVLLARLRNTLEVERRTSRRDYLTDLANDRAFHEEIRREMARCERTRAPFTLVYIDCDNFKYVNDTLGHRAGDCLLREVAQKIGESIRQVDTAGRLGGDEFAILLHNADANEARLTTERLRDTLIDTMRRHAWPITFSIGVATFVRPSPTIDAAIHAADNLMYAVKSQGKNNVRYHVLD